MFEPDMKSVEHKDTLSPQRRLNTERFITALW